VVAGAGVVGVAGAGVVGVMAAAALGAGMTAAAAAARIPSRPQATSDLLRLVASPAPTPPCVTAVLPARRRPSCNGRAVQVDPINPTVKAPGSWN